MLNKIDTAVYAKLQSILGGCRDRSVVAAFLSKVSSSNYEASQKNILDIGTNEYLSFSKSDYFDYVPVRFFLSVEFGADHFVLSAEVPDFDYGGTASATYRILNGGSVFSDKSSLMALLEKIEELATNKRNRCLFRAYLKSTSAKRAA